MRRLAGVAAAPHTDMYLPLILARINRVGVTPPPPEPEPDLLDLIEGDVA